MGKYPLLSAVLLSLASALAYAGNANDDIVTRLPEPGIFELLALGGVIALVVGIRNRRKK